MDFPYRSAASTVVLVVEIVPDCELALPALRSDVTADQLSLIGYIGKPVDETLDVSAWFTHQLDGHYIDEAGVWDDYCGTLAIELGADAPATLTIIDYLTFNASPDDISELDTVGSDYTFDIFLFEYKAATLAQFVLHYKVYPWCELETNTASVLTVPVHYIMFYPLADDEIDMTFDQQVFSSVSTTPYCEDHRIDSLNFQITDKQVNERAAWFTATTDEFKSKVDTVNIPDAGLYTITATMTTLLPNLVTVESTTMTIELEIEYDPCYLTEIVEADMDTDEYESPNLYFTIQPANEEEPVSYAYSDFYDVVTFNGQKDCGEMTHVLGNMDDITLEPGIELTLDAENGQFIVQTLDHGLHGSTFTFELTMALVDYPYITPLVKSYTIEISSVCIDTSLKIKNDGADYKTWYSMNDLELYFLYQVGAAEATVLEIDLIDTVSQAANDTIEFWQERDPFCGKKSFSLDFGGDGDVYGPEALTLLNSNAFKPQVSLEAEELNVESPEAQA